LLLYANEEQMIRILDLVMPDDDHEHQGQARAEAVDGIS